jgi:protein arginine kinase
MLRWFEQNGKNGDVVISSRVRLARNLEKYNFSLKLEGSDTMKMLAETKEKIGNIESLSDYNKYDFKDLDIRQREAMKERHVISDFLLHQNMAAGFVSTNEDISIMLNEEDHIRIQAYCAGMDMLKAYEQADKIDDSIGEVVDYAYDERYGYLTTCPSNVGTGMRVSYMCHLPALSWNNRIAGIAAEVGRFGIVLKSIYPDNGRGCGDVYQISNQVTLGRSEREIIENLTNVTEQIVSQERILRRQFNEKRKIAVLDGIYRSYGILKYARKISLKDGLMLLSELRLGLSDGLIKTCTQEDYAVYQLMIGIQPANLKLIASDDLSEEEVEIARAEFIRENLPAID